MDDLKQQRCKSCNLVYDVDLFAIMSMSKLGQPYRRKQCKKCYSDSVKSKYVYTPVPEELKKKRGPKPSIFANTE